MFILYYKGGLLFSFPLEKAVFSIHLFELFYIVTMGRVHRTRALAKASRQPDTVAGMKHAVRKAAKRAAMRKLGPMPAENFYERRSKGTRKGHRKQK